MSSNGKRKLFGTDGVRGPANQWPMTPEVAMQLGQAAAVVFRDHERRHKIIIGKDTRLSGYMIEQSLAAGICSMGADVYLVGPLPTPGIAFLTSSMRADAGVVISGSHNDFSDNGIKFFSRSGFKLPDETELRMEELIFSGGLSEQRPIGDEVGKAYRIDDSIGRYIVFLKNTFPKEMTLEGVKIVVDCANGAAYRVAPAVLEELGAEVIALSTSPNGENINLNCGSLHPQQLQKRVIDEKAHVGIALDGDADRVIFVDERGHVVDGDAIMFAIARMLKSQGRLPGNAVVGTVMSNMGLEIAFQKDGIRLLRTDVGDRYVVEEMQRGGFNFGGEPSGHLILLDQNTTGDGMIAALQILAAMQREGVSLSNLVKGLAIYPQVQRSVRVREKEEFDKLSSVRTALAAVRGRLGNEGRVLLRYSGTEPVARVMVEGAKRDLVDACADEIAGAVRGEIGA